MGVSKRINLPLLTLKSVRTVDDSSLPFTLNNTKAFSVSTFSRVFLIFVKGYDLREAWINKLIDMMAKARNIQRRNSNGNTYEVNRHLDLLVKTKGYDLSTDRYVLNARSFTTGTLCAYSDNHEDAWPEQKIPNYMTHPHLLVQKLLKMALSLAAAAAEDIDMGDVMSEKLWINTSLFR